MGEYARRGQTETRIHARTPLKTITDLFGNVISGFKHEVDKLHKTGKDNPTERKDHTPTQEDEHHAGTPIHRVGKVESGTMRDKGDNDLFNPVRFEQTGRRARNRRRM